jgi:hypothetical protein
MPPWPASRITTTPESGFRAGAALARRYLLASSPIGILISALGRMRLASGMPLRASTRLTDSPSLTLSPR